MTDGTPLAFNHDGRTLDPLLIWTAPRDGTFIVQLMGFVYPATASVGSDRRRRLRLPAAPRFGHDRCRGALPPHRGGLGKEIAEQEPNDSASNAQSIDLSCAVVSGHRKAGRRRPLCLHRRRRETIYEFKIVGAREGSPLDAWLKIENKDGKELARNDDADGSRDPLLTWTAPAMAVFSLRSAISRIAEAKASCIGWRSPKPSLR